MVGGALLNAVAFIGGNYLARKLSGDDPDAAQEEKLRHDKALGPTRRLTTNIKKTDLNFTIKSQQIIG